MKKKFSTVLISQYLHIDDNKSHRNRRGGGHVSGDIHNTVFFLNNSIGCHLASERHEIVKNIFAAANRWPGKKHLNRYYWTVTN